MAYTLIVSEKPTAAKAISEALAENGVKTHKEEGEKAVYYEFQRDGQKFVCVPAVGHLFTLKQKGKGWAYPVFDVEWVPSFTANRFSKFSEPYFRNIEMLAKDSGDIIVATDYDEEGEVIGYNILRFILGRKDAARMKFSTMTKEELIESYEHAGKVNKNLVEAGLARHFLDYYWGISMTRALTLAIKRAAKRFRILSTGRVQGPVLHMLAKHEKKIKAFKSTPFWEIEMGVMVGKKKLVAEYTKGKLWKKKEAEKIRKKSDVKQAVVDDVKTRTMMQKPPKPFNTTSLIADAYRFFGYSPRQTMSVAETLYQSGMISYPRTSSEKLPKDINYKKIITKLGKQKGYAKEAKMLLGKDLRPNEGKKTDSAHPAIYPTGEAKKIAGQNKKLYDLVVRRFFAVFGMPAKRESIKIIVNAGGELFSLTGKKTIEPGWTQLYGTYAKREEIILPDIKKGDKFPVKKVKMLDKKTQPPQRYSQGSVVKEMDERGLGTKCLTGDCTIMTPDLQNVRLDELWEDSQTVGYDDDVEIRTLNTPTTISFNELQHDAEFTKPKLISRRKLKNGEKLLKIETKGGELKATQSHPIYTYDGRIKLKTAKAVSKGDKLLGVLSRNKTGEIIVDEKWFLQKKFKIQDGMYMNKFASKNSLGIAKKNIPIKWSSDLAWVLGYFYGDGSYSGPQYNGSHQFCFTTTEKKALKILQTRIKRIFGVEPKAYLVKRGRQYKVQCNSAIATLFAEAFPEIKKKQKFYVPKEFIGDFLRGFFDADGNVHLRHIGKVKIKDKETIGHGVPRVKITLARKDHTMWLQELLENVGIKIAVHDDCATLKGKHFDCFTIRIGGRDMVDKYAWKVGFDVEHKRKILYNGLLADSLQYKRLRVCYAVLCALKNRKIDATQLKSITGYNRYDIGRALAHLVKIKVLKRIRLSPYSKPPNRAVYEIADNDYYIHALKATYEHVSADLYAAEVLNINDITSDDVFVFDLSVSENAPNFVTNGSVLVHNSTRSQILQILYDRGYILGSSVEVTELGTQMSDILEKHIPDIVSEKLTRHFEDMTDAIEQGKETREHVLDEAKKKLVIISERFRKKEETIGKDLTDAVIATRDKQNKLGTCRGCGGTLKVHKNWMTKKRFVGCSGYKKGCRVGFPLPRIGIIMSLGKVCDKCNTPMVQVRMPARRPFRMCLDPECETKKEWLDKKKLKKVQEESRAASKAASVNKCDTCDKSFRSKGGLTRHKKTHKKE